MLAELYRKSRLIWEAHADRYKRSLAEYNALALLLPSGRYLMGKETKEDDLLLIRAVTHEDYEILMQREAKEHPARYERLKKKILADGTITELYPGVTHFKDVATQPENLVFNDIIAKAFELYFLEKKSLLYPKDLTRPERDFLKRLRPFLEEKDSQGRHKNFSRIFFDIDKRTKIVWKLQNDIKEKFEKTASFKEPPIADGAPQDAEEKRKREEKIADVLANWEKRPEPDEVRDFAIEDIRGASELFMGEDIVDECLESKTFFELNSLLPYLKEIVTRILNDHVGHKILVAGRDAELFYDALKTVLKGTEREKDVMMFPGSEPFWDYIEAFSQREELAAIQKEFLELYGINGANIAKGEKYLLFDSGFNGTIGMRLHNLVEKLYPDDVNRKEILDAIKVKMVGTPSQIPYAYPIMPFKVDKDALASKFPKAIWYSKNSPIIPENAKFLPEFIFAIALQLMPAYHGPYSSLARGKKDNSLMPLPGKVDDVQINIDEADGPNASIVNPVAAMLAQKKVIEYFEKEKMKILSSLRESSAERAKDISPTILLRKLFDGRFFRTSPFTSDEAARRFEAIGFTAESVKHHLKMLGSLGLLYNTGHKGGMGYYLADWLSYDNLNEILNEIPELDYIYLSLEQRDEIRTRLREKVYKFLYEAKKSVIKSFAKDRVLFPEGDGSFALLSIPVLSGLMIEAIRSDDFSGNIRKYDPLLAKAYEEVEKEMDKFKADKTIISGIEKYRKIVAPAYKALRELNKLLVENGFYAELNLMTTTGQSGRDAKIYFNEITGKTEYTTSSGFFNVLRLKIIGPELSRDTVIKDMKYDPMIDDENVVVYESACEGFAEYASMANTEKGYQVAFGGERDKAGRDEKEILYRFDSLATKILREEFSGMTKNDILQSIIDSQVLHVAKHKENERLNILNQLPDEGTQYMYDEASSFLTQIAFSKIPKYVIISLIEVCAHEIPHKGKYLSHAHAAWHLIFPKLFSSMPESGENVNFYYTLLDVLKELGEMDTEELKRRAETAHDELMGYPVSRSVVSGEEDEMGTPKIISRADMLRALRGDFAGYLERRDPALAASYNALTARIEKLKKAQVPLRERERKEYSKAIKPVLEARDKFNELLVKRGYFVIFPAETRSRADELTLYFYRIVDRKFYRIGDKTVCSYVLSDMGDKDPEIGSMFGSFDFGSENELRVFFDNTIETAAHIKICLENGFYYIATEGCRDKSVFNDDPVYWGKIDEYSTRITEKDLGRMSSVGIREILLKDAINHELRHAVNYQFKLFEEKEGEEESIETVAKDEASAWLTKLANSQKPGFVMLELIENVVYNYELGRVSESEHAMAAWEYIFPGLFEWFDASVKGVSYRDAVLRILDEVQNMDAEVLNRKAEEAHRKLFGRPTMEAESCQDASCVKNERTPDAKPDITGGTPTAFEEYVKFDEKKIAAFRRLKKLNVPELVEAVEAYPEKYSFILEDPFLNDTEFWEDSRNVDEIMNTDVGPDEIFGLTRGDGADVREYFKYLEEHIPAVVKIAKERLHNPYYSKAKFVFMGRGADMLYWAMRSLVAGGHEDKFYLLDFSGGKDTQDCLEFANKNIRKFKEYLGSIGFKEKDKIVIVDEMSTRGRFARETAELFKNIGYIYADPLSLSVEIEAGAYSDTKKVLGDALYWLGEYYISGRVFSVDIIEGAWAYRYDHSRGSNRKFSITKNGKYFAWMNRKVLYQYLLKYKKGYDAWLIEEAAREKVAAIHVDDKENDRTGEAPELKKAFDDIVKKIRGSELADPISGLSGISQRMKEVSVLRLCVPAEIVTGSPDFTETMERLGRLKDVKFELVVTGVKEDEIGLIDSLNDKLIRQALNIPDNIKVSMLTEDQMRENVDSRLDHGVDTPLERARLIKDMYTKELASGENILIATDPVNNEDEARRLEDDLIQDMEGEVINISFGVMVSPVPDKSVFSFSLLLEDWFESLNKGNVSTVKVILPIPVSLVKELNEAVKHAWRVLASA